MTPPAVGPIHSRATFRALHRPAGRASRPPVRVAYVPLAAGSGSGSEAGEVQVGYAIGRRQGNAVRRNRIRRRLRSAVRAAPPLPPGAYLVSAGPAAVRLPYDQLLTATCDALAAASHPVEARR